MFNFDPRASNTTWVLKRGGQGSDGGGLERVSRLIERVMKKSLKSFKYYLYLA
jgi:hypothetical protein